jgi:uncharacterized low-complexity protein
VIGELLIALLLLAVAVSSLAALMYSVSRRPATSAETDCVVSDAARGKCVPDKPVKAVQSTESKLLRSGCETRSIYDSRKCKDTVTTNDTAGAAIIKPRTDSTAMALLAKKNERRQSERSDRGFIR